MNDEGFDDRKEREYVPIDEKDVKDMNMERFDMEKKEYLDRNKYVSWKKNIIVFPVSNFYTELELHTKYFVFCFSYIFCFL